MNEKWIDFKVHDRKVHDYKVHDWKVHDQKVHDWECTNGKCTITKCMIVTKVHDCLFTIKVWFWPWLHFISFVTWLMKHVSKALQFRSESNPKGLAKLLWGVWYTCACPGYGLVCDILPGLWVSLWYCALKFNGFNKYVCAAFDFGVHLVKPSFEKILCVHMPRSADWAGIFP